MAFPSFFEGRTHRNSMIGRSEARQVGDLPTWS